MQVKLATPQFLLIGQPFVAATLQARSPQLTLSWIPTDPLCSMSYGFSLHSAHDLFLFCNLPYFLYFLCCKPCTDLP
jgi:hypothetical protein